MRRRVLIAIGLGVGISFALTFCWFLLFGYRNNVGFLENLYNVLLINYFWIAVSAWSFFFTIFFTLPIAIFSKKSSLET